MTLRFLEINILLAAIQRYIPLELDKQKNAFVEIKGSYPCTLFSRYGMIGIRVERLDEKLYGFLLYKYNMKAIDLVCLI